jgi:hypothetical protein
MARVQPDSRPTTLNRLGLRVAPSGNCSRAGVWSRRAGKQGCENLVLQVARGPSPSPIPRVYPRVRRRSSVARGSLCAVRATWLSEMMSAWCRVGPTRPENARNDIETCLAAMFPCGAGFRQGFRKARLSQTILARVQPHCCKASSNTLPSRPFMAESLLSLSSATSPQPGTA